MKKSLLSTLIGISALCTSTAYAQSNMYGLLGLNYAEADQEQISAKGPGYSFAMGYEFHRQWFVELGYQQLIDEDADRLTADNLGTEDSNSATGDAIYAAVLGKARSQAGTLFYRLGVMSIKWQADSYLAEGRDCAAGTASTVVVSDSLNATRCAVDDTAIAGVVGLGFDFVLTQTVDVRLEAQHIRGEDDLQVNLVQLGVRYNF
ncbi:outer membrane beta-barrel protein [Lacimicrobium sp. SS2-24]|uniref:outer membrane beta-barrel protein n=1 Tax=Lacimicrobium sp. SS2-24 TaxID=2005569 RepID=UPI001439F9CB|nr:outer membrane beta-barrel protein [Lacimicrobium sp. SS2-24]